MIDKRTSPSTKPITALGNNPEWGLKTAGERLGNSKLFSQCQGKSRKKAVRGHRGTSQKPL